MSSAPAHITTYDCTLRDGEQGLGMSLSLQDKLRIVECLDAFGIDIIEGGYPASNPKDIQFFEQVRDLPLAHARIAAFGSTCRKGVAAQDDAGLADLIAAGTSVVTIVGKASVEQVAHVLQAASEENLRMVADSVAFLKAAGKSVVFDAEHFFDGYASDASYALSVLRAAADAGADFLVLCETNGGALPSQVYAATAAVVEVFPQCQIGIHCHNDSGCGVANSLMAVEAGATQVQGTVNGYGERVGNADLLCVIADMQLKMGASCVPDLSRLAEVAATIAEVCNLSLPTNMPYVGSAAFAHKGGLHASGQTRYEQAYEHIDPAAVGNHSTMLVSELAGKASLAAKSEQLGIALSEAALEAALSEVKEREAAGYAYEVADGSLAILLMRHANTLATHFTLESFRVIVDDREDTGSWAKDAASEATVKINVGESRFVATGEGVGPVGALDNALRLAIAESYPEIEGIELVDYKVRILDESVGTGAITRVTITSVCGHERWGTVGVSENVIEASWNALVDSIEYGLFRLGK